ncbi:MAG TPA: hypothetical protein VF456_13185, partial [Vicinamibacterales bacterium]
MPRFRAIVKFISGRTFVTIRGKVSAASCLATLRAAAAISDRQPTTSWPVPGDPMFVRVTGARIELMKAAGGPPRNNFRRKFYGTVREHDGALIRGSFWPHPVTIAFSTVWLSGVGYAAWTGLREGVWVLVAAGMLL